MNKTLKHLSLLAIVTIASLGSARADVPVIDATSISVEKQQYTQLQTQTNVLQQILQLNQQMLQVQTQLNQAQGLLNDPSNLSSALSGNFQNMTGSMLGGVSQMFGGNFSSLSGLMSDFTQPLQGIMQGAGQALSFGQQISGFFGGSSGGSGSSGVSGSIGVSTPAGVLNISGGTSGVSANASASTASIANTLSQFDTTDRANLWGMNNSQVQNQTLANTAPNMQNISSTLQRGTQDRTVLGKLQTANELTAQNGATLNEQNAAVATAAQAEQAQNDAEQLKSKTEATSAGGISLDSDLTKGPRYADPAPTPSN